MELLLDKGANPEAKDRLGRTPLERAQKILEMTSESSELVEIIKLLENYQQKIDQ